MKKVKTSTVTISAMNTWLRHVWVTSENGKTCRRIKSFVVFNDGRKVCEFDGTDVHDELKDRGKEPITFETPIKWTIQKDADLTSEFAHMVRADSVWEDVAYTLYIPAKYAQVEELEPVRSGEYMIRRYHSPILGRCTHHHVFPKFERYALHEVFEKAAKEYFYTGLDIAKPHAVEYMDDIIAAIHEARREAEYILSLSDSEFFAAFDE